MTTQPSVDGTRLSDERYLELFDADLASLLDSSGDLDLPVPGCPGWTVRDLLSHVIGVYRHKSAALDADAAPTLEREGDWGDLDPDDDPRAVLRTEHARLRERLTARPGTAQTWTWWPPEQTVAFWVRRMAQETAVHRWDAQSAVDVDGAGAVPDDLASDGVDELLGWLRWGWDDERQDDATGQTVLISTADHGWVLTFTPTEVSVASAAEAAEAAAEAVAFVAAEPTDLLLHLWGRPGTRSVAVAGDVTALRLLDERLRMATT
jgi:uncharacterized protein (TIGR03083 family)